MKRILFLFLIITLIASCESFRGQEQTYSFSEKTWHLDTIPEFNFEIKESERKNVIIHVRNTVSYPYQNLYLTYTLIDNQGQELERELVNLQVFDEKTGKPFGKGSSIYSHELPILENYQFPYQGEFTSKWPNTCVRSSSKKS